MISIAHCDNQDCHRKMDCFRYMAIKNENTWIVNFKNLCGQTYVWFWPIGETENRMGVAHNQEGDDNNDKEENDSN